MDETCQTVEDSLLVVDVICICFPSPRTFAAILQRNKFSVNFFFVQYRPVVNDFPSLHMQSFVDGMRFRFRSTRWTRTSKKRFKFTMSWKSKIQPEN